MSTVAVAALDGATYRVAAVATTTGGYDVYVALPLAEVDQSTAELARSQPADPNPRWQTM